MGTFSLPLPLEALLFKLICSNPLQEDPFIMAGDKPSTEHVELASPLDKSSVLQREYTVDEDVKKLDWYIMPMLWIMYWLNYLDRNAIALARLDDLEEDLNLTDTQYQTCVSILFVGYILGQVPSNMLLTRLRPSWYMAGFMALWAIVSALTALSQNFTGL